MAEDAAAACGRGLRRDGMGRALIGLAGASSLGVIIASCLMPRFDVDDFVQALIVGILIAVVGADRPFPLGVGWPEQRGHHRPSLPRAADDA